MFGLTEQVGGHPLRVGGLVGEHRDLGGAGEQVDADPAEQLPLGLGDEGVARTDEHVDRRLAEQPERHGAERLHAADGEHPVGAGQVGAVEHGRVRAVLARRRGAREDGRDAGGLGDADGHERARQQREAAGGQVGADAADRDVLHAAGDAGREVDLEVGQVRALRGREAVGALVAELERVADVGGQRVAALAQVGGGTSRSPVQPSSSRA